MQVLPLISFTLTRGECVNTSVHSTAVYFKASGLQAFDGASLLRKMLIPSSTLCAFFLLNIHQNMLWQALYTQGVVYKNTADDVTCKELTIGLFLSIRVLWFNCQWKSLCRNLPLLKQKLDLLLHLLFFKMAIFYPYPFQLWKLHL